MIGSSLPSTAERPLKFGSICERTMPARAAAQFISTLLPRAAIIPIPEILALMTDRLVEWLATDIAGPLVAAHRDHRALDDGKWRRVLVVVEHQIHRAWNILALEFDVEGEVHELGFALDLVGGNAEQAARLVAGADHEIRVLDAHRIAVAAHRRRTLRRVR